MGKFSRSLSRRKSRNITSLKDDLVKDLTKPDSECDKCTRTDLGEDCYLHCPELFSRNKEKHRGKINQFADLTGDHKLKC